MAEPTSKDVIIPIVFPDYKISTPVGNIGDLGHAGILVILGGKGTTKYYEYGRYDSAAKGLVRKKLVSDVKFDKSGKIDKDSLKRTLQSISNQAGHSGRISGAYIEVSGGYTKALTYMDDRMKQNTNKNREEYGLFTNNCGTFMKKTAESAGASMPVQIDPRPNSYIEEIRNDYPNLDYDPKTKKLEFGD